MAFAKITPVGLKMLGLGLVLFWGCGQPVEPPKAAESPKPTFTSKIEVRLDRPTAGESFEPGADIDVSGSVALPPGSPVPDVLSILILAGRLNHGSYVAPLKATEQDDILSFSRVIKAPAAPGAYSVRAEAVIASELTRSATPPPSPKKRTLDEHEPGRAASKSVQIRVVRGSTKK